MKHNSQISILEPITFQLVTYNHTCVPDLIPCLTLNFVLTTFLPFLIILPYLFVSVNYYFVLLVLSFIKIIILYVLFLSIFLIQCHIPKMYPSYMVLPFKEVEKTMSAIWTFPFHRQMVALAGDG